MPERILIADDDAKFSEMISILLTRKGYTVRLATNGTECLEIADAWQPDLILVDIMMPEMHGFDAVKKLREMKVTATTPILIITAMSRTNDKIRGFEAGADDYITKPFENEELLIRIESRLRRARLGGSGDSRGQGKVIAVFTLRGGAGSSTLAVNLSIAFTELWRNEVALLDLGLPIGACDVMMSLPARNNLAEIARVQIDQIEAEDISSYMVAHSSGVQLLGGILNPVDADFMTAEHAQKIIDHLRRNFAYVIIDLPHLFSELSLYVLDQADDIVMPVPPDVGSLRVAVPALKTLDTLHVKRDHVHLVVNSTFSDDGYDADRIEKVIKREVTYTLPHDHRCAQAVNAGKPMLTFAPDSPMSPVLEDIAWDLSRPLDSDRIPDMPSEMWKRINERIEE